jgi:RNA polymerase sigma-70 factor (ECF subfamily)
MPARSTDTSASEEDRLLVDAVLAGDTEAFRALVDREGATVMAVCRRILADPTEAEDATQDAFLAAYQKLGSFRGDGPLGGWLMRIAIREARHRGRRRRPMSSFVPEVVTVTASDTKNASPDPAAIIEADEFERWLHTALDGLPDHYRDAVRLHYLDELSYEEIATITGRRQATVRAHARRGLLRLRDDLVAEPWT